MPASIFRVPASVTQNIARAKAAVRRKDPLKCVECLLEALNLFEPRKIIGKAKYETEILLLECLNELNHHPRVMDFLKKVTPAGKDVRIPYAPGQEEHLAGMLQVLARALREDMLDKEEAHEETNEERKAELWRKGNSFLREGDLPRGKAVLRRMVEEFGQEPGVQAMVGEALFQVNCGAESIEFLENAISIDPSDNKPYTYLVSAYTESREFKKAERMYKLALRRFGQHYKTLINFAGMYKLWNKRDECYDIATMALKESPNNPEAQDLLDWADRKK